MKYSREFYQLIGHINPAMYDAIYPMNPFQYAYAPAHRESKIPTFQSQGSVYGTDPSGELTVLAKFSWRMRNLLAYLQPLVAQAKMAAKGAPAQASHSFVSELVDEYCGNGIRHPFPPRPHGISDKVTIEEKVAAAALFAHASFAIEGTEIGEMFAAGADKILDSAIAQLPNSGKVRGAAYNDVAISA